MSNPFNIMASIKTFQNYITKCPKCDHVIVHKTLKPGEKLACKKCGNTFKP